MARGHYIGVSAHAHGARPRPRLGRTLTLRCRSLGSPAHGHQDNALLGRLGAALQAHHAGAASSRRPSCRSARAAAPVRRDPGQAGLSHAGAPAAAAGDAARLPGQAQAEAAKGRRRRARAALADSQRVDGSRRSAPFAPLDHVLEQAVRRGASDLHLHSELLLEDAGARRADRESNPLIDRTHRRAADPRGPDRRSQAEVLDQHRPGRLLLHAAGRGALPRQRLPPAARPRRGVPRHPASARRRSTELGLPQLARASSTNYHQGLVLVTGPAGCGKSSTHGGAGRPDQRGAPRPHPHHRGSDRVRAPVEALPGEPAPGAAAHRARSRARCAPRCARTRT